MISEHLGEKTGEFSAPHTTLAPSNGLADRVSYFLAPAVQDSPLGNKAIKPRSDFGSVIVWYEISSYLVWWRQASFVARRMGELSEETSWLHMFELRAMDVVEIAIESMSCNMAWGQW